MFVFDFDGVIADSFQQVTDIFHKVGKEYGVIVNSKDDLARLYENNIFDSLRKKGLTENEIQEMILKIRIEQEKLTIKMFPGMKTFLKKINFMVITSNIGNIVKKYLNKHNLKPEQVIGAEHETSKVKKLLKIKNNKTFYIGDTVGDIKEGKLAKVKTIAVTWGFHKKELLKKQNPDFIVDSIEDLENIYIRENKKFN